MDAMLPLIEANKLLVGTLIVVAVLAMLFYINRHKTKYFLMEADYKLPIFGRASRLMRRRNHRPDGYGWFPAESKVCSDYFRFYRHYRGNRAFYEKCRIYLRKVGELGRRPMPLFLGIIIVAMVVAEAYGFAYVLTLWGFVQAAEQTVPFLASGLAALLAIVAVFLTHATGTELYANSMLRRVRRDFIHDPRNANTHLQPSQLIAVDDDQHVDDNQVPAIQALNRLGLRSHETRYVSTIAACIFIVIVAVGSTYIRLAAFDLNSIDEQRRTEEQVQASSSSVQVGQLPGHLVQQNVDAGQKASDDRRGVNETGAWMTFIVMAAIFVAIQAVSIMLGFRYGFVSKESETAWRYTFLFDNAEEYEGFYLSVQAEIGNQAQARLADIQGRILRAVERDPTGGPQLRAASNSEHRTFLEYVHRDAMTATHYSAAPPPMAQSFLTQPQFQNQSLAGFSGPDGAGHPSYAPGQPHLQQPMQQQPYQQPMQGYPPQGMQPQHPPAQPYPQQPYPPQQYAAPPQGYAQPPYPQQPAAPPDGQPPGYPPQPYGHQGYPSQPPQEQAGNPPPPKPEGTSR